MSWKDRATKVLPIPGSDMTSDWRSRATTSGTVPTELRPLEGPDFKVYPDIGQYDMNIPFRQGWAPNEEQFLEVLKTEGFEDMGGRRVKAPDGEIYNLDAKMLSEDWLIKNSPDIAISLLSSGAGLLAGGAMKGAKIASPALKWLLTLGAESGAEGLTQGAGEILRQEAGIASGQGQDLDIDQVLDMAKAGAAAPAIAGGLAGVGRGLKKAQNTVSGVPKDIADAVRRDPFIMNRIGKDLIEQDQLAFTQRLASDPQRVIKDSAKIKGESLASSEIEISPQELDRVIREFEMSITRPLGEKSPLGLAKADLEKKMPQIKQMNLVDAKGRTMFTKTQEEGVTAEEIAAFKRAMQDLGKPNPNVASSYKEKLGKAVGSETRKIERTMISPEAQIETDRLAALNKLKEQFPSLKRSMNANEEDALKTTIFNPSRERVSSKSFQELDPLISDPIKGAGPMDRYVKPFSPEFEDIVLRRRIAAQNRFLPRGTGGDLLLPMVTGAAGVFSGPVGPLLGLATGGVAQSPGTTLTINQFLGYLDKLGASGKGRVGKGASFLRDAALIESLED